MVRMELKSKVGADGILSITVPVGMAEANREVRVTVEPADEPTPEPNLLAATYGSCSDLGLEEPADLPLQERELL